MAVERFFGERRAVGERASSKVLEAYRSQCIEQLLPYSVSKVLTSSYLKVNIVYRSCCVIFYFDYSEVLVHQASSEKLPVGRYVGRLR